MKEPIHYGGLVVAIIGFAITRSFVAATLRTETAVPFLIAGLVPLVVGLAVTVYGVVLLVGPFSTAYVYETTRWCVVGTASMVLVVVVTSIEPIVYEMEMGHAMESPLLVGNVVLFGAAAGVLFGDRVAKTRMEQRENRRQANRALLVNRLLRHEVLNAATIVDGHADLLEGTSEPRTRSVTAIRDAATRIRSTVEDVGTIAASQPTERIDLESVVRAELSALTESWPEAVTDVVVDADSTTVVADQRVAIAVRELLRNALENGAVPRVDVTLAGAPNAVALTIADDGPGLPADQRALLEAGSFPEYDDPSAGFGLQIVHLLVDQFGGEIRVGEGAGAGDGTGDDSTGDGTGTGGNGVDAVGTAVTVLLPDAERAAPLAGSIGVPVPDLYRSAAAGLVAGAVMGSFFSVATGFLPVIGALYGVASPVVGWVTHLFHSVVFALLFAVGCTHDRLAAATAGPLTTVGLGLTWGAVLWLVAAGVIMPAWLSLVGISTPLPNLSGLGLVGHALWGVVLGATFWLLHGVELRAVR